MAEIEEKEYAESVGIDGLEEIFITRKDGTQIYINIVHFYMLKNLFEGMVKMHIKEKEKYSKEMEEARKRKFGLTS